MKKENEQIEKIENKNGESEKKEIKRIVPDTSVLIQGKLTEYIKSGKLKNAEIIIPVIVLDELQAQASRSRDIGFQGLQEIKNLRKLGKDSGVTIKFTGKRPTMEDIQLAKKGRLDALIRDTAAQHKAVLLTADYVQALIAEVEGIEVEHIPNPLRAAKLHLEDFFTPDTQSVHIKEGAIPLAKKGKPGELKLVKLRDKPLEDKEIKDLIDQIVLKARSDKDSFIEMDGPGSLVIQLGNYRIAIARPPFSDGAEITAVRPIAKVNLADYKLHSNLEEMLTNQSIGIMIAGPPGSGKSTFAASIADYLANKDKIVKTFEQPRDLQVGPEVPQYAPLNGDWERTAEVLLLVRPDYTIFDEVRRTKDFKVFADMRLAGVGMIGVMHASDPINSIQRFIGRIELGMIPHVVDIVIFIRGGKIEKVYELSLTVKVPSGMIEADLARPVVQIRDFETKKPEFEIYSYGEENVIVPISDQQQASGMKELAKWVIFEEFRKYDKDPEVQVISDNEATVKVRSDAIAMIIGKGGSNIELIQKRLGIHLNIEPKEQSFKSPINFQTEESGGRFNLLIDPQYSGKQVDVYYGDEFLMSPTVGQGGCISVRKKSEIGKKVMHGLASKKLKILV